MKYAYNGNEYTIEFKREHKTVTVFDAYGNAAAFKSKHPYTTVTLYRQATTDPIKQIYRTATVGAYWQDAYTHEEGRLAALRAISKTLTKESRKPLWEAYINRARG